MQAKSEEIEVKFYLTDPVGFAARLTEDGAIMDKPRCYERDLRYDDRKGSLTKADQVLRLRMDDQATLTYKGSGVLKAGASSRQEIEVKVSDFDTAQKLLEALGYHLILVYEKYRTTYTYLHCAVVLDQMPYGWFCEIEGENPENIKEAARKLGLNWEARIVDSYTKLFQIYKDKRGSVFNDLTFANFKTITVTAQDLGVSPAD